MASGNTVNGAVAWWRRATKRPALFWALAALTLMIGVEGVGVLVWPPAARVNAGALPAGAAWRRSNTAPQPNPASLEIPSIGVATGLESLAIDPTGVLAVPKDYGAAGWWSSGPAPGADGAAVIVGHVDSHKGAAVFYRLRQLNPGDEILVRRVDGSSVTFAVDALRQYPKNQLPTRIVYGPTATPSLRLITCAGSFDRKSASYRDNVVVFAHLVDQPNSVQVA